MNNYLVVYIRNYRGTSSTFSITMSADKVTAYTIYKWKEKLKVDDESVYIIDFKKLDD